MGALLLIKYSKGVLAITVYSYEYTVIANTPSPEGREDV
jgi:hypothetical protein